MKTIRLTKSMTLSLTEKQYQKLLTKYRKFYLTETECTEKCPLGSPTECLSQITGMTIIVPIACEICYSFEEFPIPDDYTYALCPCDEFGQEAFERLRKMLIRKGRLKEEK